MSTPAAVAVVRGTRFRVSGEGETPVMRAEVEDGLVEVANDRASVTVPAGSGTLVRADARPERPRPLLRPVDLGALPARFERRQLRIGWPPAEAASAYRVQISESVGVSATLLDELVETSRVTLPDPPDGNYVLKVRAVDGDGLEGIEAQHAFELDARPEPPATIAPRPGRTVRVVRPALRWAATADAVAYRVQVARDAGFTDLVLNEEQVSAAGFEVAEDLADGAYHWRVATGDASGEVGPFGDVQAFTVRKAPPAPDAEAEVSETGILLRWQAGLAGQTYEVQFAADEQFTESVRTEATEQPESAIEPPERALWFRVRIVDVDGYLGPYGTTQRIDPPKEDPWWMLLLPLLLLLAL